MPVRLRRAYEARAPEDGARFLVDRLWPRGVSRERLAIVDWLPELAPSDALRRWYGHDPDRFPEFRRRYRAELAPPPPSLERLVAAATAGTVTLVFGAKDAAHSNAAVLAELIEGRLAPRRRARRPAARGHRAAPSRSR